MEIKFDKKIYKKSAVLSAARECAGDAGFTVTTDSRHTIVKISGVPPQDRDAFIGEFGNFVIFKTRERR